MYMIFMILPYLLEPVKFHDGTQFTNIDVMKKYHKEDFETGLR